VDETYVRVGGKWKYLFRAVDKHGRLIAFMLSDRRNTNAAYRFLRKAIRAMSTYPPSSITTDKLASYPKAILRLQNEGLLPNDVVHRTSKYLNNILEADHGALKRVIRPTRGFQTMKTAAATLKGFEIMRMIRRGHCIGRERRAKSVSLISSSDLQLKSPVELGSLCPFQVTATVPGQAQPREPRKRRAPRPWKAALDAVPVINLAGGRRHPSWFSSWTLRAHCSST
jgi:hypothetical protein